MRMVINQFRTNISRVRALGNLYKVLHVQTTDALDLSDILRSQLVLTVSAFDYFIHELVRVGMLEAYEGQRSHTPAFLRFQITLDSALQGFSIPTNNTWLDNQIRTRHGYRSFQRPDNVANAIRLISDKQLWDEVAEHLSLSAIDIKQQLSLIVTRRDQIAHEADVNPSYLDTRWPIDDVLVDEAINFIEQLTEAIYKIV